MDFGVACDLFILWDFKNPSKASDFALTDGPFISSEFFIVSLEIFEKFIIILLGVENDIAEPLILILFSSKNYLTRKIIFLLH